MAYIKGTEAECLAYDDKVTTGENYTGITSIWSKLDEIEGFYYILVNDKYPTALPTVPILPYGPELL